MERRSIGGWLALWLPASAAAHAAAFALALQARSPTDSAPAPAPAPAPASATLNGGETFDIDPAREAADEATTGASSGESATADEPNGETRPSAKRNPRKRGSSSKSGPSSVETVAQVFGAAGDRSAVDLGRAFAHTFPQVASADPAWATVTLGSSGSLSVTLDIDDAGNLVRTDLQGDGSSTLRRGVERTLTLLRHRLFTAHARTTTLRVAVTVSPNAVHDGLHGDVFALGGDVDRGDVFFALAVGRRVDIAISPR